MCARIFCQESSGEKRPVVFDAAIVWKTQTNSAFARVLFEERTLEVAVSKLVGFSSNCPASALILLGNEWVERAIAW